MSEEHMNDSTFSRLFIIMILLMSLLAVILMVLAASAASDVNERLDARGEIENSNAIAERIAPVGAFASAPADSSATPTPVVEEVLSGEQAYSSCAACHTAGIAGAPQLGSPEAWQARIAKGIDSLYSNAIDGYQGDAGFMPAKGGNASLSDDAVKAAVDYMVSKVE